MNNFQKNLERIMNERELTQTDIADMAHAKQNSVSRWLKTDSLPNMKYIQPLAKALGLTVSELLGDYSGGITLSDTDRQLLELPKHRKEFVLKMLDLVDEEIDRKK